MFLIIIFFASTALTTHSRLFNEIFNKVKAKIDYDKLKKELKISNVQIVDDNDALLILTSMIYCKKVFKNTEVTVENTYKLVKTSQKEWQLVALSEKLLKFNIAKFLNSYLAKKYSLAKLDINYIKKTRSFYKELDKIKEDIGLEFPKEEIQVQFLKNIQLIEDSNIEITTIFEKDKEISLRYNLAFHPEYKTFSADISFVIPRGTVFKEVNHSGEVLSMRYRLLENTKLKFDKLILDQYDFIEDTKHLRLLRAFRSNIDLSFIQEKEQTEFSIENGVQLRLKNNDLLTSKGNEFGFFGNLFIPDLLEKNNRKVAIEHFLKGQTNVKSKKNKYHKLEMHDSQNTMNENWILIATDRKNKDYNNFYHNRTDSLIQNLTIKVKNKAIVNLTRSFGFKIEEIDHKPIEIKDLEYEDLRYSTESSFEDSGEELTTFVSQTTEQIIYSESTVSLEQSSSLVVQEKSNITVPDAALSTETNLSIRGSSKRKQEDLQEPLDNSLASSPKIAKIADELSDIQKTPEPSKPSEPEIHDQPKPHIALKSSSDSFYITLIIVVTIFGIFLLLLLSIVYYMYRKKIIRFHFRSKN